MFISVNFNIPRTFISSQYATMSNKIMFGLLRVKITGELGTTWGGAFLCF